MSQREQWTQRHWKCFGDGAAQCRLGSVVASKRVASTCLSSVAPRARSLVWLMMGGHSLRWMSSVNDLLRDQSDGSLRGELRSAMLAVGLSGLGRSALMSLGIIGSCVISSWVVTAW